MCGERNGSTETATRTTGGPGRRRLKRSSYRLNIASALASAAPKSAAMSETLGGDASGLHLCFFDVFAGKFGSFPAWLCVAVTPIDLVVKLAPQAVQLPERPLA